jgi:hypothetical protein
MVEAITNFDMYAMVAVGLFVAGLFAIMVYEKSKPKSRQQQQPGTAAANEK